MLEQPLNIALMGLGGQGIVTLTRMIADTAFSEGIAVCYNEIHGLAQRGGSVQTSLALGRRECPVFPKEHVHVVVGLEKMETLRYLADCPAKPVVVVSQYYQLRETRHLGLEYFPKNEALDAAIEERASRVLRFNHADFEETFPGALRPYNAAMFGALVQHEVIGVKKQTALETLEKRFSRNPMFLAANQMAFEGGQQWLI